MRGITRLITARGIRVVRVAGARTGTRARIFGFADELARRGGDCMQCLKNIALIAVFAVASCDGSPGDPASFASAPDAQNAENLRPADAAQEAVLHVASAITTAFKPCDDAYATYRDNAPHGDPAPVQQKCLDATGDLAKIALPDELGEERKMAMGLTVKLCTEAAGARSAWMGGMVKDGFANASSLNLLCIDSLGDAAGSTGLSRDDARLKTPSFLAPQH